MQQTQPAFYLNERHFSAMIVAACLVHMAVLLVYMMIPREQAVKIPVHVLNIKLGSGDFNAMAKAGGGGENLSPRTISSATFEPQISAVTVVQPKPATAPKAPPKPKPQPKPEAEKTPIPITDLKPAPITQTAEAQTSSAAVLPFSATARPSQYVREDATPGPAGPGQGVGAGEGGSGAGGSPYGNSVSPDAEVMHRYTQLISMWVNKHKGVFIQSLQPGMKGNIIVRLQIDRRGNIHFFKLDKGTGVPAVDAAAGAMVRAANPVPPVPANYPGGNMFEFLISVGYTAKQ